MFFFKNILFILDILLFYNLYSVIEFPSKVSVSLSLFLSFFPLEVRTQSCALIILQIHIANFSFADYDDVITSIDNMRMKQRFHYLWMKQSHLYIRILIKLFCYLNQVISSFVPAESRFKYTLLSK